MMVAAQAKSKRSVVRPEHISIPNVANRESICGVRVRNGQRVRKHSETIKLSWC